MAAARDRLIVPERLDEAAPLEAVQSLRDLVRINRFLGGHRTLDWLFSQVVAPDADFSVLDVGSASGDMAARIRSRHPHARVTCFDRLAHHLEAASGPKTVGDAFALPFAPRSFDFVFSSLFLHHFENERIVELLRSFSGVARRGVLAIDLERGPLSYHFIPATRWLFGWDPITLYDAPASVNAGFKTSELQGLAQRAGLAHARVRSHRPWGRLSLIAPL